MTRIYRSTTQWQTVKTTALDLNEQTMRNMHVLSLKLLDKAPAHLIHRAKIYQECLGGLQHQKITERQDGYRWAESSLVYAGRAAQELIKLSAIAEPTGTKSGELVVLEIYHWEGIRTACIGHYADDITIIRRGAHRIVRVPRWAYQLMVDAIAWETAAGWSAGYMVGEAYPTPSDTNIAFAATLWEPAEVGPYKAFRDSLKAVKLLV